MRVILKYFAIAMSCFSIFPISEGENITFIKNNGKDVSIETLFVSSQSEEIKFKHDGSSRDCNREILNTGHATFLDIQNKLNNASDERIICHDVKTFFATFSRSIDANKNLTIIGTTVMDDHDYVTLDVKVLSGIFSLNTKSIVSGVINFNKCAVVI